jgi:hypothetical protein
MGLIAYLAIVFKTNNNLTSEDIFCAIFLIGFAGMTMGNAIMYFPDINGAKTSIKRIFKLLDLKDEDQLN